MTSDQRHAYESRKVLLLVSELHLRGYQLLRALPGMAPSGMSWRCSIAPSFLVSPRNGAHLLDGAFGNPLVAHYTSAAGTEYFGWTDAEMTTPSGLARLFIERFPEIVEAGRGSDWSYAGWYVEMLGLTYPNRLPYAYSDWEDDPEDCLPTISVGASEEVQIPLPPPGSGSVAGVDVSGGR